MDKEEEDEDEEKEDDDDDDVSGQVCWIIPYLFCLSSR